VGYQSWTNFAAGSADLRKDLAHGGAVRSSKPSCGSRGTTGNDHLLLPALHAHGMTVPDRARGDQAMGTQRPRHSPSITAVQRPCAEFWNPAGSSALAAWVCLCGSIFALLPSCSSCFCTATANDESSVMTASIVESCRSLDENGRHIGRDFRAICEEVLCLAAELRLLLCSVQEFLVLQLMDEARRKHDVQPY